MTIAKEKNTYLYHPDNKEEYRETALSYIKEDCVRSRHILSYLDMPELSQSDSSFSAHVSECEICQKRVKQSQKLLKMIDKSIPVTSIHADLVENFESEISQLISLKDSAIKSLGPEKDASLLGTSTLVFKDFFQAFFSIKTMAFLFATVAIIFMLQNIA